MVESGGYGFDDYLSDAEAEGGKGLDFDSLLWRQLDTIRIICSREFHKGIILYNESGAVSNYIPDVLDSYANAVKNLYFLLIHYSDEEFNEDYGKLPVEENKKEYFDALYIACLGRLKRLGKLPKEFVIAEAVNPQRLADNAFMIKMREQIERLNKIED